MKSPFTKLTVLFLNLILLGTMSMSWGQVTYTKDIAPIIYDNCTKCHRPGEIGPMPFTNYNEVKTWGSMIEYVTEINYMPPWKANLDYSTFQGERYLTAQQKQTIKDWVNAGMPEGDPSDEPDLPIFPSGSQIGEPDLVLSFSQKFDHAGNNEDQYQNFVLPTGLTEDKVLKAIELRPGNSGIVHHALFALDTTGAAQALDAQTPEYGYAGFGGFNVDVVDNFPGYVPGSRAVFYPEKIGQPVFANSDLLVQMHYAPISAPESDSSTVNIFFADTDETITRNVMMALMIPFGNQTTILNGPFVIRANQTKTFHGTMEVPIKVSAMAVAPHMHLLGKDWTVYAVSPQGDTTNLINIPDWDFNWQGFYFFKKFKIIEAGSTIHAFATYDNTASNPLNPNDPPKRVSWGEATTDEMYYLPLLYVPYLAGDDTVNLEVIPTLPADTTSTDTTNADTLNTSNQFFQFPENKFYPVFPNPVQGSVNVGFALEKFAVVNMELFDLEGKMVAAIIENRPYSMGHHKAVFHSDQFSPGLYILNINGKDFSMSQKILIK